jgi:cytochrome c553
MKKLLLAATALAFGAVAGAATVAQAADVPPPWAYGYLTPPPPDAKPAVPGAPAAQQQDNTTKLSVPGSKFEFTRAQVANRFGPADWFPEDHGPVPEIVAHGKQSAEPQVWSCQLCHLTNGRGRPENANLTGLSQEYIIQQLTDFRNGVRKTSDPRKDNTARMASFTKSMTEEEMKQAAAFFSSIPAAPWVKVVESETAPKVRSQAGLFLALEGDQAGTEPIGNRIVEVPQDNRDAEFLRNSHTGFIAYVPPGSLNSGRSLVAQGTTSGGATVTPCTVCHGPTLRGLGPVPRLAGRSPSYIARQLFDMKEGNRAGTWTPLMKPVLAGLNEKDILNAAAYLASLQP